MASPKLIPLQKAYYKKLLESETTRKASLLIGEFQELTIDLKMEVVFRFLKNNSSVVIKEFVYRHFSFREFTASRGLWNTVIELDKWINPLLTLHSERVLKEDKKEEKSNIVRPRDDIMSEIMKEINDLSTDAKTGIINLCNSSLEKASINTLRQMKAAMNLRVRILKQPGGGEERKQNLKEAMTMEKVQTILLDHVEERENIWKEKLVRNFSTEEDVDRTFFLNENVTLKELYITCGFIGLLTRVNESADTPVFNVVLQKMLRALTIDVGITCMTYQFACLYLHKRKEEVNDYKKWLTKLLEDIQELQKSEIEKELMKSKVTNIKEMRALIEAEKQKQKDELIEEKGEKEKVKKEKKDELSKGKGEKEKVKKESEFLRLINKDIQIRVKKMAELELENEMVKLKMCQTEIEEKEKRDKVTKKERIEAKGKGKEKTKRRERKLVPLEIKDTSESDFVLKWRNSTPVERDQMYKQSTFDYASFWRNSSLEERNIILQKQVDIAHRSQILRKLYGHNWRLSMKIRNIDYNASEF